MFHERGEMSPGKEDGKKGPFKTELGDVCQTVGKRKSNILHGRKNLFGVNSGKGPPTTGIPCILSGARTEKKGLRGLHRGRGHLVARRRKGKEGRPTVETSKEKWGHSLVKKGTGPPYSTGWKGKPKKTRRKIFRHATSSAQNYRKKRNPNPMRGKSGLKSKAKPSKPIQKSSDENEKEVSVAHTCAGEKYDGRKSWEGKHRSHI